MLGSGITRNKSVVSNPVKIVNNKKKKLDKNLLFLISHSCS